MKKPVSKLAFQMQPAALHRGDPVPQARAQGGGGDDGRGHQRGVQPDAHVQEPSGGAPGGTVYKSNAVTPEAFPKPSIPSYLNPK